MTGPQPRRQSHTGDAQRVTPLAALGFAWATLLAALFVCAGPQALGAPADRPHTSQGPVAQRHAETDAPRVCSPLGHGGTHGRDGCGGSSDQGADGLLPVPPPQAGHPALAWTLARPVPGVSGPTGPLRGIDLAPDLHVLQVLRT